MRIPDLCNSFQRRIGVNHDRIRRVAMRTEDLFLVGSEVEGGYLRRCTDCVYTGTSGSIPDVYLGIVRAATCREKGGLPGAPTDSLDEKHVKQNHRMWTVNLTHLHSSCMIPLRPFSSSPRLLSDITNSPVPNIHHIVIPTAR